MVLLFGVIGTGVASAVGFALFRRYRNDRQTGPAPVTLTDVDEPGSQDRPEPHGEEQAAPATEPESAQPEPVPDPEPQPGREAQD